MYYLPTFVYLDCDIVSLLCSFLLCLQCALFPCKSFYKKKTNTCICFFLDNFFTKKGKQMRIPCLKKRILCKKNVERKITI